MKKKLLDNKALLIVVDSIIILLGVVTVVVGAIKPNEISRILSIIIASALFMAGIAGLIYGFMNRGTKFITPAIIISSIAISIGVLLCWKYEILGNIIVYFIGSVLSNLGLIGLISGIVYITDKQELAKNKKKQIWKIIASFAICAVGVTLGVLIFIYSDNENILRATYILGGAFVCAIGIISLIGHINAMKEEKEKEDEKEQKTVEAEVVDTEVEETKEETSEASEETKEEANEAPKEEEKPSSSETPKEEK